MSNTLSERTQRLFCLAVLRSVRHELPPVGQRYVDEYFARIGRGWKARASVREQQLMPDSMRQRKLRWLLWDALYESISVAITSVKRIARQLEVPGICAMERCILKPTLQFKATPVMMEVAKAGEYRVLQDLLIDAEQPVMASHCEEGTHWEGCWVVRSVLGEI